MYKILTSLTQWWIFPYVQLQGQKTQTCVFEYFSTAILKKLIVQKIVKRIQKKRLRWRYRQVYGRENSLTKFFSVKKILLEKSHIEFRVKNYLTFQRHTFWPFFKSLCSFCFNCLCQTVSTFLKHTDKSQECNLWFVCRWEK